MCMEFTSIQEDNVINKKKRYNYETRPGKSEQGPYSLTTLTTWEPAVCGDISRSDVVLVIGKPEGISDWPVSLWAGKKQIVWRKQKTSYPLGIKKKKLAFLY